MAAPEQRIEPNYAKYRKLLEPHVSEELMTFIDESDFRIAPASTREEFHGCYKGGLLEHSLGVYRYLRMFNEMFKRPHTDEQVIRTALLHDLCKIGCYHETKKWRKDENGKWEKYLGWSFEDDFPAGHGSKSVAIILSHGTQLTNDEILAITHHMGAYNLTGTALLDFQQATKVCPLVLFAGWADLAEANIEPYMIARKQAMQAEN